MVGIADLVVQKVISLLNDKILKEKDTMRSKLQEKSLNKTMGEKNQVFKE